jgi:hypothetical protein
MERSKRLTVLTVTAVLLGGSYTSNSQTTGKGNAVEGRVSRSDRNSGPAADVEVELQSPVAPYQQITKTKIDANGRYALADVKPGKYHIVFTMHWHDDPPCVRANGRPISEDHRHEITVKAGEVLKYDVSFKCN